MEEKFVKLIKRISEDYEDNKYMNYIKYIQFPKYKNLTDGSRIEFNFPLTMLVGKNGTERAQYYRLYMVARRIKVQETIGFQQMLIL